MSFYAWIALDRPGLIEAVAGVIRRHLEGALHPGALLRASPPWTPLQLLRGAPALPGLRTLSLGSRDRRGRVLSERGYREVLPGAAAQRRGADFVPEELLGPALSRELGGLLALAHSDHPPAAYAAHYTAGRCRWSVALRGGEELLRYDGEGLAAIDLSGGRAYPEGDRAGVLLAGLARLLGEPLSPGEDERLILADAIAWGPEEGEALPLVI